MSAFKDSKGPPLTVVFSGCVAGKMPGRGTVPPSKRNAMKPRHSMVWKLNLSGSRSRCLEAEENWLMGIGNFEKRRAYVHVHDVCVEREEDGVN